MLANSSAVHSRCVPKSGSPLTASMVPAVYPTSMILQESRTEK